MAEIQIFIKLLTNKTLTLHFPSPPTPHFLTHHIQTLTHLPPHLQTLTLNGKLLTAATHIPNLSTVALSTPLLGGKGGFGSLLRGAATKAGQKKTNNFDACRDMSGRRLRHVNAEKRLEEWKAGEGERKLEKVAEEYLKERVRKGKGGRKEEGAEKYVEKYRVDSARCVEDVERSVREAMAKGRKRKVGGKEKEKEEGVDAKKLKIWMGKRKMGESESDSDSEAENDAENEKSAIIDNGSQSDSSKDASSASISAPQLDGDCHGGGSSDSCSEEEKETVIGGSVALDATPTESNGQNNGDGPMEKLPEIVDKIVESLPASAPVATTCTENVTEQLPSTSTLVEPDGTQLTTSPEGHKESECKSPSPDQGIADSSNVSELLQPLNFDDFNSATELEVLGMERLKSELQARGLKCGGTLQERAARLFLLKTTPLDKLPKKLLAKK